MQSAAVFAIGPSTSNGDQILLRLFVPTTPFEGLMPAMPQNDAGVLREPAKSEPVANGTIPDATAAAPPPVDAPALRIYRKGFPCCPEEDLL